MPTDPFVSPELDGPSPPGDQPRARGAPAGGQGVAGRPPRRPRRRAAHRRPCSAGPGPTSGTRSRWPTACASGSRSGRTSRPTTRSSVVAELGMKRAASFGRAPTMADVEVAATLLGYLGEVDAGVRRVARRDACTAPTTSTASGGRSSTRSPTRCCACRRRSPACSTSSARRSDTISTADGRGPPARMIRVRFSPAPTGSLHIGSARTALFNWLYARHHDGVFVLRIEDTDVARSRDEWVVGIQDTLRWLGHRLGRRPDPPEHALRPVPRRRRPAPRRRVTRTSATAPRTKCASATTPRSRPVARRATTVTAAT